MNQPIDPVQDRSLDESTGVNPQHFDEEGYVIGHPHHTAVAADELGPDGRLAEPDESIAPPPVGPDDPVPGAPEGVPVDPDLTPDEPAPLEPEQPDERGETPRTVGGEAF